MTNRRHQYNNNFHSPMAVTLDSANSDFCPGDTDFQIHFRGSGRKKEKEKKTAAEWKNENTNLLIVTSAACWGETAGCQTLKGTEAEFNASCQESLMWLSPPARAGIVKLSGSGKDAQTALRDAPLAVPSPGTLLRRNRGWEGYTIFTNDSVCSVWQSVWMCACVNSGCVDNIGLHFLTSVLLIL